RLFGEILRLRNILTSFDDFADEEILSARNLQDLQSSYLDIWNERKLAIASEKESIIEEVVFEIELIKQVEINVDYILMLVQKYRDERGDGDDKELRARITRAIDSSPSLRNKKDLIEEFVDSISATGNLADEWSVFVEERCQEELQGIIEKENLKPEETERFIAASFRDGAVRSSCTAITKVMPPVSRFSRDGNHGQKKQRVIELLTDFYERFFEITDGNRTDQQQTVE